MSCTSLPPRLAACAVMGLSRTRPRALSFAALAQPVKISAAIRIAGFRIGCPLECVSAGLRLLEVSCLPLRSLALGVRGKHRKQGHQRANNYFGHVIAPRRPIAARPPLINAAAGIPPVIAFIDATSARLPCKETVATTRPPTSGTTPLHQVTLLGLKYRILDPIIYRQKSLPVAPETPPQALC
jgi:hypothetical protein